GQGERFRKLTYPVLRIITPNARPTAAKAMIPFGPLLIVLAADGDAFLERASAVLVAPIHDPTFNCFPFYVPLLEARTLASAAAARCDAWMGGASIYIRESFEDKGTLILSRQPLTPLLKQFGWDVEE